MNKKELILSTGNLNKVKEIKYIFKDLPINILSKNDLGFKDLDVKEDGQSLEENAIKKAKVISDKVNAMVIADDSGLFVEYLNGVPGLYSSRYAGDNCSDEDNNIKLLEELEGVPIENRKAYFDTVIALIKPDGDIVTLTGRCNGYIGFQPEGEQGFGYDPLFIVDGYNKTFAQLGEGIKNKISHRAIALDKLKNMIIEILKDEVHENICSK